MPFSFMASFHFELALGRAGLYMGNGRGDAVGGVVGAGNVLQVQKELHHLLDLLLVRPSDARMKSASSDNSFSSFASTIAITFPISYH